jgi:predicted amidophosphoribosyltransferase
MRCRGVEYGFDSAWPLFRYAGVVRSLVLAYKSGQRRSLALFFAEAIAQVLQDRFPGRIVVPVPPRPGKVRRKGWDQVEDLARILERRHGVIVRRILIRADGKQQKALDLEGRAANMRGKIGIVRAKHGQPCIIPADPVLLDDVLTTGATLSECARALKAAGSVRVDAVAIAAD